MDNSRVEQADSVLKPDLTLESSSNPPLGLIGSDTGPHRPGMTLRSRDISSRMAGAVPLSPPQEISPCDVWNELVSEGENQTPSSVTALKPLPDFPSDPTGLPAGDPRVSNPRDAKADSANKSRCRNALVDLPDISEFPFLSNDSGPETLPPSTSVRKAADAYLEKPQTVRSLIAKHGSRVKITGSPTVCKKSTRLGTKVQTSMTRSGRTVNRPKRLDL